MAKLKIIDGPGAGAEFGLGNAAAVIGRHADCAISLADPKASRNHAEIFADRDGQYSVIDLGSSNGTRINGTPLVPNIPRHLSPGDILRIGQCGLRFFADDSGLPDLDIPGYALEEILAEGGMGSIYRATERRTGRTAAVKILHADYARHGEFVGRFIQEARAAARLTHPNIIKVYNVGKTANGRYYFTMELIQGRTLTQRIGELAIPEAARIFMEIADALDSAHRHGIIHRDIKPDNILIGRDGEPKLTDLGIAILDQAETPQFGPRILGTPHYMSPEQASGKTITASTDIYSLGAAFYHVFAGHPPFDAGTPEEIMIKHVRERPRPLAEAAPGMPPEIARVVDRALAKDPGDRYPDAGRLRDAIVLAVRRAWPGAADERRRLAPGAAALLLAGLAAALFAAWLFFR
ncbi:MAG: protein kinase [Planctomycetota bacterium]|jgi:serine/threonine protein kinase|nr:protein kinase [Planctomycetota bacterium]